MRALSIVAGIVLVVALYAGVLYLAYSHESFGQQYQSDSGNCHGGDVVPGLILWVPIFLFPGAVLTGFFIQPHIEKSWISFLFYSPATVAIVIFLLLVLLMEPTLIDLLVYGGICLIWLLSSCPGVALGYKLREWVSGWVSRRFYN
jgi:hypothetical protein